MEPHKQFTGVLNKTSPGAKKLLSRIALSVRRYLAGGAASAHLPLSRKCYFDVLSAAACDCEPQSHINSISRQTETDRRTTDGGTGAFGEAGGGGGDGVQHVTLTTAMKKRGRQ